MLRQAENPLPVRHFRFFSGKRLETLKKPLGWLVGTPSDALK
jgi:hypothetical protein